MLWKGRGPLLTLPQRKKKSRKKNVGSVKAAPESETELCSELGSMA